MTLISILEENVRLFSKSAAIIEGSTGHAITYRDLGNQVEAIACGLVSVGIKAGDRVALYLPNGSEFIISYFAILKIGAIAVPFNIQLKSWEIKRILENSGAKAIIGAEKEIIMEVAPIRKALPNLNTVIAVGLNEENIAEVKWDDWLGEKGRVAGAKLKEGQPAAIHYTSGTTGQTKGVLLTHKNIAVNSKINGHYLLGLNDEDRVLGLSPYCHSYFIQVVLGPLSVGAAVVTLPRSSPVLALEAVEKYRVTHVSTVPTMYKYMLAQFKQKKFDVSSWHTAGSAATNISLDLVKEIQDTFEVDFFDTYGCTETSSTMTYTRLRHYKPGSVGRPAHGCKMKVIDNDENEVPTGEVGEIAAKSPAVFSAYWQMPEKTKESFTTDGWFKTGDLGRQDQEGYIYLVGRKKDMIVSGGYKIYPWEIEQLLLCHPCIAEAAVIGKPDTELGEIPVGYVILKPGANLSQESIMAFCQERIARYKCPRAIEFATDFPRSASGKIIKRLLKG